VVCVFLTGRRKGIGGRKTPIGAENEKSRRADSIRQTKKGITEGRNSPIIHESRHLPVMFNDIGSKFNDIDRWFYDEGGYFYDIDR